VEYPDVSRALSIISVVVTWLFLYILYVQLVQGQATLKYPFAFYVYLYKAALPILNIKLIVILILFTNKNSFDSYKYHVMYNIFILNQFSPYKICTIVETFFYYYKV
jgi:hypothetical protein